MTVTFIVNPRSAGGGTSRRLDRLRTAIGRTFDDATVLVTEHAQHATTLAASVDTNMVVAVGGDGTANEVVNGLAARPASDRPAFAVLPAGTGCDLVRSVGTPRDLPAALRFIRDTPPRPADWIVMEHAGGRHVVVNVAGFGLSGAVVKAVNEGSKFLGGTLSFGLATARATAAWRAPHVTIDWVDTDGGAHTWTGALASCFLGNGSYCGGGMLIGPGGRLDDGVAELTIIPHMSNLAFLKHARRLYDGRIVEVPGVVHAKAVHVEARAHGEADVLLDADGEQPGGLPVVMDVEPGAVRMVCRWR